MTSQYFFCFVFVTFIYFYFYSVNHCGLLLLVAGQESHTRIVRTHQRHNKCNKHITAPCYIARLLIIIYISQQPSYIGLLYNVNSMRYSLLFFCDVWIVWFCWQYTGGIGQHVQITVNGTAKHSLIQFYTVMYVYNIISLFVRLNSLFNVFYIAQWM